jgi:hypothetical protein
MISQRGAIIGATRTAATLPSPSAAANGMKQIPACSAELVQHDLHVQADHHSQRQQHPARQEQRHNVITRLRLVNSDSGTSGFDDRLVRRAANIGCRPTDGANRAMSVDL